MKERSEPVETPELIIRVYNAYGHLESALNPAVSHLLKGVTVASVRCDEQGFHIFVITQHYEKAHP